MDGSLFGDYISTFSRAQALEDGVLVDITDMAKQAGVKFPIAVTSAVWHGIIEPDEKAVSIGESNSGRLWDMLTMMFRGMRRSRESVLFFGFIATFNGEPKRVNLKSIIGPGDDQEPVHTVMKPDED